MNRKIKSEIILILTVLYLINACRGNSSYESQDMNFANQGYNAMVSGDYEKAEAFLEVALSINPQNPYALLNLGVVYQNTGRIEEARKMYRRLIELNPVEKAAVSTNSSFHGKRLVEIAEQNLKLLNEN